MRDKICNQYNLPFLNIHYHVFFYLYIINVATTTIKTLKGLGFVVFFLIGFVLATTCDIQDLSSAARD